MQFGPRIKLCVHDGVGMRLELGLGLGLGVHGMGH